MPQSPRIAVTLHTSFISITINNYCSQSLVISCAYFPCFVNNFVYLVDDVIVCIDNVLAMKKNCLHVIDGDFNFDCVPLKNNFCYSIFADVISDYKLICCDKYVFKGSHTYQRDSLGHYSWLENFFISTNMQSFMQSSEILDSGINTSDHLHIFCTCNLPIIEIRDVQKSPYIKCTVKNRWDKADLLSYFNITGSLLHEISVPVHLCSCPIACNCTEHRDCISQYYNSIVTILCRASLLIVPRIPFKCLKPFRSDDLDRLKEASLDMQRLLCQ